MQQEVYNAAGNIGGSPVNVSSTAKSALQGPQTKDSLVVAKSQIHSLVTSGQVKIQDNMHLLLGTVNRQFDGFSANGTSNGLPTSYHTFDTLQILAVKLK